MANEKLYEFSRQTTGFCYVFSKTLKPYSEAIIVKMPAISANKRGVNDIGWMANGQVIIEGTLSKDPKSTDALWQEIRDNDEINKTVSAVRIRNTDSKDVKIEMRAILY